jgi:hypothetical protein
VAESWSRSGGRRLLSALLALGLWLGVSAEALAASAQRALILATAFEVSPGQYAPASVSADERTRKLGLQVYDTVREGVQDLGLTPLPPPPTVPATDDALGATEPSSWVFAPRLKLEGEQIVLRLVALSPRSRVRLTREEEFTSATLGTLDVRTVVMLRDLYTMGKNPGPEGRRPSGSPSRFESPSAPPSSGRSVLALNAAVLGGYVGFTIQKASRSPDVRLVYPLVALGTGLGLGASLLVADEWNIGSGDAWYLAAGIWWPTASGVLLSEGYGIDHEDRYAYGLLGAGVGLTLGAAAIAVRPISEGGAVLAHSGGAFGALLGAMTDAAVRGTTGASLRRGVGFGTGAGVLLGGALATQVTVSPSRALLIDLAASLGTLGGASLASPLLIVNETNPARTRLWLASAGVGTIAGGVIGWLVTSSSGAPAERPPSDVRVFPSAGLTPDGNGPSLGVVGAF